MTTSWRISNGLIRQAFPEEAEASNKGTYLAVFLFSNNVVAVVVLVVVVVTVALLPLLPPPPPPRQLRLLLLLLLLLLPPPLRPLATSILAPASGRKLGAGSALGASKQKGFGPRV